jgi:prephenate dehydrogenase
MRARKIAIIGVGLIGGSLGLALKRHGFNGVIEGYGRRRSTLDLALQLGAVDMVSLEVEEAGQADIAVICTPVEVIPEMVERIAPGARLGCVITDVGSVKRCVVERAETIIESLDSPASFVGGHPMAGSEKSGVLAARADLFEGAKCILTPTDSTPQEAIELVEEMWRQVGARTLILSPQKHDHLIAAASHLVHLSASALAETVGKVNGALELAATGFRDTTRVASGLPYLWREILSQNADMLLPMIDALIEVLAEYKTLLSADDAKGLEKKLEIAKRIRDSVN